MYSRYYQTELSYLRELGRAYAAANPSVAGMLAERGGDPDVERLLEGFAFLTARIRERIDDAVPEIVHGLAELLLPHYVRPVPSCSILEFTPALSALRGRVKVPRGTEVASIPVDGTACRFRTTSELELLPLAVKDATFDRSSAANPVLQLRLETTQAGIPAVFAPGGIRFFLNGELPVTSAVLLALARHCRAVVIRSDGNPPVRLPPDSIRLVGFDPEHALFPWGRLSLPGYRLLQEYFTIPAKLLFFEVRGLENARAAAAERFEINFELERAPELPPRLGADMFRLHCTPIINLFETTADPIRQSTVAYEHLLRASGVAPLHMEIYSVERVEGTRAGEGRHRVYPPFVEFAHPPDGGAPLSFFRVRRTSSPVDTALDCYLSVISPRDVMPDEGDETLSVELVCTNRDLTNRLRAGDISVPTRSTTTNARFRNISAVTAPCRPPLGNELHWRLLSHLALNHRSLADAATLRALLGLYNFAAFSDQQSGLANQLRLEAIRDVRARAARRVLGGAAVQGTTITVEISEGSYAGRGDAFLFGAVLDALFADHVALNSFTETVLALQPSSTELRWGPRTGHQTLV